MRRLFKVFPENINTSSNYFLFFNFVLYLTITTTIIWLSFSIRYSLAELNSDLHNNQRNPIERQNKMLFFKFPYKGKNSGEIIFRNLKYHETKQAVQKNLTFIYYKNGKILLKDYPGISGLSSSSSYQSYLPIIKSCINEKISFIFHGWTENCYTEWIPKLVERLTFHRGGCIICVDYSVWSKKPYIDLLQKFEPISDVLYEEVLTLIQIGFNPSKIFMFGFSYGGQIASKIGRTLKPQYNINKMDICDMAGPGFDFLSYLNHSEAADNVQCYYSSLDKGSHFHSCHQNIRLGHCGYTQPAILSQPYFSSHGLCVRIYINAFDYPFYALQNSPLWCERNKTIKNLPQGFTVGYREGGYNDMIGDIFVPTSMNYPYNLSKKELILYEKYLGVT